MLMLPKLHRLAYAELQEKLESLSDRLDQFPEDVASLFEVGQEVQSYFQSKILPLPTAELSPQQEIHLRSLQTEIHRTLRLILTDLLFLKTAKTLAIQTQKRQILRDRLALALGYCQQLILKDNEC
jgi:hypothetical protein